MLRAIPATLMRGGTSKGLYFDARDLPGEPGTRDRVLLAAMGSPDIRQIDGVGGAHPLTSKVAVIGPATRPDVDVDYLFLQVAVDKAEVSDSQNCGNLLAGVGPWAIENGLVRPAGATTSVRIHMVNTASVAVAHVPTPEGLVEYEGETRIDGVPGTAAGISIDFLDVAGSSCGALFPTGGASDRIDGIQVTCIDNGMPVVILDAADFGLTGNESPQALEANAALKERVEKIRLALGPRMNLGEVARKTVPKMSLVSPARHGGQLNTRTFIPHRVHEAIGVLGAVSVATACAVPGTVAERISGRRAAAGPRRLEIEHPTGFFTVEMDVQGTGSDLRVNRSALLRTARKLMRGEVYVPAAAWGAP
ncbi:MAG TPA: 4-oxalomesaconate tautomerase [Steroidobacteraceae bacterium]|nr:4-oxalomesaconate tautomerase [Steroidobacteraceae bacterium]